MSDSIEVQAKPTEYKDPYVPLAGICTQCHTPGDARIKSKGYAETTWVLFILGAGLTLWSVFELYDSNPESIMFTVAIGVIGRFCSFLWLCHFIWRIFTFKSRCTACGATHQMVAATTPRGKELLGV